MDRAFFSPTPDYLLKVQGDSMRDEGIFDGDLIGVHRTPTRATGQIVVIARIDDEVTVKLLKIGKDRIRLLPRNPDYAPIEVQPDQDFAIEGLYCGLVRPNREPPSRRPGDSLMAAHRAAAAVIACPAAASQLLRWASRLTCATQTRYHPTDPRGHCTMDENKKRALSAALGQIEKQFGKGSVMRMGDRTVEPVETIGTGSLMLDIALGIGGLPKGRVVEIYGPESSGKTTLTLQTIAECQKAGGTAPSSTPSTRSIPTTRRSWASTSTTCCLAARYRRAGAGDRRHAGAFQRGGHGGGRLGRRADPKAEIEGEMGDQLPGLQARLMSQALRKLTGNIKRSNCMVIFINQLRMKIGIMMPGQSPEVTTGGNALKFYASVRLDIRRIGSIKKGDEIIGNQTRIKVVKNKLAPPFKQVITEILYGEGISREGELIDMGVDAKLVEKVRCLVQLRRRAHRPGQGKRPHSTSRRTRPRR
jgi:recombination protein RecA